MILLYLIVVAVDGSNEPSEATVTRQKRYDKLATSSIRQQGEASSCDAEKDIVLIKIGGSSITEKAQIETLDQHNLEWFSTVMAQVHRREEDFIIVHGAGSFGHFTAKEYGIRPYNNQKDDVVNKNVTNWMMHGFSQTRHSVQTLNRWVVKEMLEQNISAMSISPGGSFCPGDDGVFGRQLIQNVRTALQAGLTPVLHGDGCLLRTTTSSSPQQQHYLPAIVGGDDLMQVLAESLHQNDGIIVKRAIFITDVNGIYTTDPKRNPETARLLKRIKVHTDGSLRHDRSDTVINATASTHDHDVTGGLESKLKAALSIARQTTPVAIVPVGTDTAIFAMEGKELSHPNEGTWLVAE